jgi:hypothetical protein
LFHRGMTVAVSMLWVRTRLIIWIGGGRLTAWSIRICIFALDTMDVRSSDISLKIASSALDRVVIVRSRYGQSIDYTKNADMGQLVVELKKEIEVRGRMLPILYRLRQRYLGLHWHAGTTSSHRRNVNSAPSFSATRAWVTSTRLPHMPGCTAPVPTFDA